MHQNIQHLALASRLDILKIHLEEIKPDIVALSEHKMPHSDLQRLNVNGFKLCSYFSRKTSVGGGVMILCKSNVVAKKIILPKVKDLILEKEFECSFTLIEADNFSFVLSCIYRTPEYRFQKPFLNKFENYLEILMKKYKNVVIVGDINIDVLENNLVYKRFCNILNMFNLHYLVNFPTRVTDTSKTAIDNIITNIHMNKNSKVSGLITEISDHDAQLLRIQNVSTRSWRQTKIKKFCRNFSKKNIDTLIHYLSRESWVDLFKAPVASKFIVFSNLFMYYLNVSCPKEWVTLKFNSNNWITQEIKNEKAKIIELSKLFRVTHDVTLKTSIKEKKKELKKSIDKAKKKYFDDQINKSDNTTKTTWKLLNQEIGIFNDNQVNISIYENDNIVINPVEVGTRFNDYFADVVDKEVVPKIDSTKMSHSKEYGGESSPVVLFRFEQITEQELSNVIHSFKNTSSSGLDEIPITLIKKSSKFYLETFASHHKFLPHK